MTYYEKIDFIKKNLAKMEANITKEVTFGAEAVQAKVITDARSLCPTGVTGTLAQSIQPGPITVTANNVEAIVEANADYASFVEFPTKPHFPPVAALQDWAEKILGDAKLAFVVARAISRRGTYAQPFMGPALLQNMGTFVNAIVAGVRRGIGEAG